MTLLPTYETIVMKDIVKDTNLKEEQPDNFMLSTTTHYGYNPPAN
jgi:hypothetical protein